MSLLKWPQSSLKLGPLLVLMLLMVSCGEGVQLGEKSQNGQSSRNPEELLGQNFAVTSLSSNFTNFINTKNNQQYLISGVCTDPGESVRLAVGTKGGETQVTSHITCLNERKWEVSLDLSPLEMGEYDLNFVFGSDSNLKVETYPFLKDIIPPTRPSQWSIASADQGAKDFSLTSQSISGQTLEAGGLAKVFLDQQCATSARGEEKIASDGSFNLTLKKFATDGSEDGLKKFYGVIEDLAGNEGPCTDLQISQMHDTQSPTDPVLDSIPAWNNSLDFTVSFTPGQDLFLKNHQISMCSDITCSSDCVSVQSSDSTVQVTGLTEGAAYYVCVQAEDESGKLSNRVVSTNVVNIDTLTPAAPTSWSFSNLSNGAVTSNTQPHFFKSGLSVQDGGLAQVFIDNTCSTKFGEATISSGQFNLTNTDLSGEADGSFVFYGRLVDPAGNSSSCSNVGLSLQLSRSPILSFSPAAHAFGDVEEGQQSSPITVTLSNNGGVTASGCQAPDFGGAQASSMLISNDNCSTNDLAPGASCSFDVKVTNALALAGKATLRRNCSTGGLTQGTNEGLTYQGRPQLTVTLSSIVSEGATNAASIPITATFSHDPQSLNLTHLTVANATTNTLSGSGSTYQFNLVPGSDGAVTLDLQAAKVLNTWNFGNLASNQLSFDYDSVAPTATITTSAPDPTNSQTVTFNLTLSENIPGFSSSNLTLTNATIDSLSGSGTSWSATLRAVGEGVVGLAIAPGAIADAAGNSNVGNYQSSVSYDGAQPSLTLTHATIANGGRTNSSGALTLDLNFSEAVSGFEISDVVVSSGSLSQFTGSGASYSVDLTPSGDGPITFDVGAGAASDGAGNVNQAAAQFSLIVDTVNPTATITTSASDPTPTSPIPFTITFSEDVVAPELSDFNVTNGSVNNLQSVNASTYTVDLTPAGQGAVDLTLTSGSVQDLATNSTSSSYNLGLNYDSSAPGLTLSTAESNPTNSATFSVTLTATENISGLEISDFSVVNGSVANLSASSGTVITFDFTPSSDGALSIQLNGGVVQDSAGNGNTASNTLNLTSDTTAPTVSSLSSSASDPTATSPIPFALVFSEAVTGFDLSDLTLGNGSASNLSGSGSSYTFDVTPTADGVVSVQVNASAAVDAANNNSSASSQLQRTFDSTVPTATLSSAVGDPTNAASFSLSVSFSENVTGLELSDFTVGNATLSNLLGGPSNYTLDVTPSGSGSVSVQLPSNQVLDGASNQNPASNTSSTTADYDRPDLTLSSASSAFTNTSPIAVTATFSEDVSGFSLGDLSLSNATASNLQGGPQVYTFDLTPSAEGAVTVDAAAGVAQDASGNQSNSAAQLARTYDSALPTATLSSAVSNPTSQTPFSVSLDFSENVTGLSLSDIAVTNGSASNLSGSGSSYTFDVTPSAQGAVLVDLASDQAVDQAGNGNSAATQLSRTFDSQAPTVSLSSAASDPVNSSPFAVTITFSESVSNFTIGDIAVTNASLSNFSGSGANYSVDVTPSSEGAVTVNIASDVAQDGAGNQNSAASELTRNYDSTAPTLTLSSAASQPTNSSPIAVTFTFSESVSGFTVGDIVVGNGSASNFSGSDAVYSADITPSGQGNVTVDVNAGVAQDNAGNANTAATQLARTYDSQNPSVAITSASPSQTNASPIAITITFSESVTGLSVGDLIVSNGVASNFSGSGAVYSADISPSGQGVVSVDLNSSSAADSAGNGNTAAPQFTRSYDTVSPTPTLSTAANQPTNLSPFSVTITWSEDVSNFTLSDLTVSNGVASNFSGSGSSYSVDITPSSQGQVDVDISAGVANDSASNSTLAATQLSRDYDGTAPTVTLTSAAANPSDTSPINLTITFSEAVADFVVGDLVLSNASSSNFSGSGTTYSVDITPSGQGVFTVDLPSGRASDSAGNGNSAATQYSNSYDTTAPTVTLSSSTSAETNTSPIDVTVTFSESVSGFTLSDIAVTGGSKGNFSGSGATYTFDLTPSGDGALTVDVAAGVAQDSAGNDNTIASTLNRTYDTTNPTISSITSSTTDPTSTSPIDVTITFSEDVTGLTQSDLTLGNATASNFTAVNAQTYTVDLTPTADVTVTLDINSSVASDGAGNPNSSATQFSRSFDGSPPGVTLSSSSSNPSNDDPIVLSIDFTEAVTGFTLSDLSVTGASASNFSGSGASYSVNLDSPIEGSVTVDLAADQALDSSGNGNTAATQFQITHDSVAPTATLSTTASDPTSTSPIPVTLTFSEDVSGVTQGDFVVTNGSAGTPVQVSASNYTVDITPTNGGTVEIDFPAGRAADGASNGNTAATTLTRDYFVGNPPVLATNSTLELNKGSTDMLITNTHLQVTDADAGDTPDQLIYTITTAPTRGQLQISGVNKNLNDTFTQEQVDNFTLNYDHDNSAPTSDSFQFQISDGDNILGPYTFNFTIDTSNSNPTLDTNTGLTVLKGTLANQIDQSKLSVSDADNSLNQILYTLTSAPSNGTLKKDGVALSTSGTWTEQDILEDKIVYDHAGGTDSSDQFSFTYSDGSFTSSAQNFNLTVNPNGPTVTITSSESSPTDTSPIPITITFSESVTGFVVGDISTSGNVSISNFSGGSGTTYTADLTSTVGNYAVITVDVAANVANNASSIGNRVASQFQITYDAGAPALSWSPNSFNFGEVPTETTSSTQTFTLSNTGGAAATGCSAPTLVGSNSGDFSLSSDNCGSNDLAASASCSVQVKVATPQLGGRSATLRRSCTVGGTVDTLSNQITYTGVTTGPGAYVKDLFSGMSGEQNCAITHNHKIICWGVAIGANPLTGHGSNNYGSSGAQPLTSAPEASAGTSEFIVAGSRGSNHSCLLTNNGKVKCFGGYYGNGYSGQDENVPIYLDEAKPFVDLGTNVSAKKIATGDYQSCVITETYQVKCWGLNSFGVLGLGDTTTRGLHTSEMGDTLPFVDLGANVRVRDIAVGDNHACVVTSRGKVKCWGKGEGLGYGDTLDRGDDPGEMGDNLPYVNLGAGRLARKIAAGIDSTCALLDNNQVKCWGTMQPVNGQESYINITDPSSYPEINLGTNRSAIDISLSGHDACAILEDNTLKCWGYNGNGQLGQGHTNPLGAQAGQMGDSLPTVDLGPGVKVKKVVSSYSGHCALTLDHRVKCWGYNASGQLGYDDTANRGDNANEMGSNLPYLTLPTVSPFVTSLPKNQGAYGHTCVNLSNNATKCWGYNGIAGQLGLGDEGIDRGNNAAEMGEYLPMIQLGNNKYAKEIFMGTHNATCALLNDHSLKCWGAYYNNGMSVDIGDQPNEMGDNLAAVPLGTNVAIADIDLGYRISCGVMLDGQVKCWGLGAPMMGYGDNYSRFSVNQMGDNLPYVDLGTNRYALSITSGTNHSCSILDDLSLKCWGQNSKGQLGLGDAIERGGSAGQMGDNLPTVNLGTNRKLLQVEAFNYFTCARLDNKTVKCWGDGYNGQLGYGDTINRGSSSTHMGDNLQPVDLGTGRSALTLAPTMRAICALLDNGSVKCWGRNTSGELGQGDTFTRGDNPNEMGDSLPAVNLGSRKAVEIVANYDSFCVLLDDSTVKCWGFNTYGELGLGDALHRGNDSNEMGSNLPTLDFW